MRISGKEAIWWRQSQRGQDGITFGSHAWTARYAPIAGCLCRFVEVEPNLSLADLRYRPPNGDLGPSSSIGAGSNGYRDPYMDSDLPDIEVAEDFKQIHLNDDMIVSNCVSSVSRVGPKRT
jgi:hypothetical protein